jgi:hypothetical protein
MQPTVRQCETVILARGLFDDKQPEPWTRLRHVKLDGIVRAESASPFDCHMTHGDDNVWGKICHIPLSGLRVRIKVPCESFSSRC